jgi:hypothetical protein
MGEAIVTALVITGILAWLVAVAIGIDIETIVERTGALLTALLTAVGVVTDTPVPAEIVGTFP